MLHRHPSLIPAVVGLLSLVAIPLAAAVDEHEKEMTAEVIAVDVDTGRLTVEQMDAEIGEASQREEYAAKKSGVEGKKITLAVDADTRITEDGKLIALAELRPGERVNITYETKQGETRAVGVDKPMSER